MKSTLKGLAIIILQAVLLLTGSARAQEAGDAAKQDKIKALEIAYISRELDLTPEEAQKFWPVYNRYSKEVGDVVRDRKARNMEMKGKPRTDELAAQAMDKELNYERRMLDIKTRYKQEFMKVLPARKVGNLYKAEREFRGMMIRQLKERRDNNKMLRGKSGKP
ncbi:hypothetical protein ACWKWU_10155 [Chitinophaga lutea]